MILVLGANGQLGTDLINLLDKKNIKHVALTRSDVDIENLADLKSYLKSVNFDFLVNCTSYHKTDEVEDNPEKAFLINAKAPKIMADICSSKKSKLIHISTDYVFGGNFENSLLSELSCTSPLNIYGLSKLQGENFIKKSSNHHYIFRVASLFGEAGASGKGGNFVEAIYKKAKEEGKLSVVNDQIMSPTSTKFIAKVIYRFITNNFCGGIYNVVNKGEVSWFDFAKKICDISNIKVEATPISADTLNLKAMRPSYSALSTEKLESTGIDIPTYEEELRDYLISKGHIQ